MSQTFSGNVYIFHAFDVGDDISLEGVNRSQAVQSVPLILPKYFKNYHTPLAIELPHPHNGTKCIGSKIHHFGALSLTYKVPFEDSLENLRTQLSDIDHTFQKQAVTDAAVIFRKIKKYVKQPKFFLHRTSYLVVQVDADPQQMKGANLKTNFGSTIASMLRFETVTLSELQKNEILEGSLSYFRGELIVIDTNAAFVYDPDYPEILDLFDFSNVQNLELQYFDKVLDNQLNLVYERKLTRIPWRMYLPFIGTITDPVAELGQLRVDISVITERLQNSIRLAGEAYVSDIYDTLEHKLDLNSWKESITSKLAIVKDVRTIFSNKVNNVREDLMTLSIIGLIFIELMIALWK